MSPLIDGASKPYTKRNNKIKYINKNSNHVSRSVIRWISLSIELRLSTLSFNENIFKEAAPPYQKELENSGYRHTLTYKRPNNDSNSTNLNKIKQNGKREIMWFSPPVNLKMKQNDCNWTQTYIYLVSNRTLNHLANWPVKQKQKLVNYS